MIPNNPNYFSFLVIFTICMIFLIFVVSFIFKMEKEEEEQDVPRETKQKSKAKSDTVIDTLNWMLENNIIDTQEYNRLMGKSLQYM